MTLEQAIEVFDAAAKIPANPMSSGEARFLAALPVILRAAKAVMGAPAHSAVMFADSPSVFLEPDELESDSVPYMVPVRIVREDAL
jgi:hypothetical protein